MEFDSNDVPYNNLNFIINFYQLNYFVVKEYSQSSTLNFNYFLSSPQQLLIKSNVDDVINFFFYI
jgi:hypothetical protein